jgi:hypothetical protein
MNKFFRRFLAATTLGVAALGTAGAEPVVITFGGIGDLHTDNFVAQGFVFSPSCHYDFVHQAMAFDRSGCSDPQYVNPAYLGGNAHDNSRAFLYVARVGGGTFSLKSLDLFIPAAGFDVTSSKGGYELFIETSAVEQQFQGAAWTELDWVRMSTTSGLAVGFTEFVADAKLPEPATLALVALALAGLPAMRRAPPRS